MGDKLSESDAGKDEDCAGSWDEAEAFSGDEVGRNPCENGFEGEQKCGVRSGKDGLRPALDGECGGGGERGGDDQSSDQARSEMDVRVLDKGQTEGHE